MKTIAVAFLALCLGWFIRPITEPSAKGATQAATTKADLISLFRSDATSLLATRAKIRAHKASYDALSFSWIDGDFTGSNAGITASQFTTAVANLADICDKFDAGGTLAAGLPTNVNRIANINVASVRSDALFQTDRLAIDSAVSRR